MTIDASTFKNMPPPPLGLSLMYSSSGRFGSGVKRERGSLISREVNKRERKRERKSCSCFMFIFEIIVHTTKRFFFPPFDFLLFYRVYKSFQQSCRSTLLLNGVLIAKKNIRKLMIFDRGGSRDLDKKRGKELKILCYFSTRSSRFKDSRCRIYEWIHFPGIEMFVLSDRRNERL